ncbi:MAG: DUF2752 domain-containing protein [Verrucomicrobia bacterium]|nr:DUF2752 domain-containing protein [Verrucomicrobiota bacterium]
MIDRRARLWRLTLGLLLLAAFPAAWLIRRLVGETSISPCVFRTVTGRPCPFCGLTRAFANAVECNWRAAFSAHPLWWLAATVVAGAGLICLLDAARNTNNLQRLTRFWNAYGWHLIVVLIIVAVLSLL